MMRLAKALWARVKGFMAPPPCGNCGHPLHLGGPCFATRHDVATRSWSLLCRCASRDGTYGSDSW